MTNNVFNQMAVYNLNKLVYSYNISSGALNPNFSQHLKNKKTILGWFL
jgi:hypothetical protein